MMTGWVNSRMTLQHKPDKGGRSGELEQQLPVTALLL